MRPDIRRLVPVVTFAIAFVVRLTPVLIGGGLGYFDRYDDGVYYTAADALTFGRVPYRDFILLHPPGSVLVLTPFAALGRATSDGTGLAVARLVFMGIGGLNAVLVTLIAARWGRWQSVLAGLMYAGWAGAVYSEQATFLEPLGGTALLVALFLLLRRHREPTPRDEILAGVALGLACSLKIWYIAPLAVVVLYQLIARRYGAGLRVLVSGMVSVAVVLTPFFVLAPRRMWDMVIRDQLLRSQGTEPRNARFEVMLGVKHLLASSGKPLVAATVIVIIVLIAAAIMCVRDRIARLLVAVLAGNIAVLYLSPTFYRHYAVLVAPPLVLVFVIGLTSLISRINWRRLPVAAGFAGLAFLVGMTVHTASVPTGRTFPGKLFGAVAPPGCITSDDPAALIQMNRLSQDFRDNCRVPVDVSGVVYDSLRRVHPDGSLVLRSQNLAFQDFLFNYLTSGHAFVIIRRQTDSIPPKIRRLYGSFPAITRKDGITLRAGYPLIGGSGASTPQRPAGSQTAP